MAKKSRTPPPPRRPVQAPQRRVERHERSDTDRRTPLLLVLFAAAGLVALAAVIIVIAVTGGKKSSGAANDAQVATTMRTAGCTFTTTPSKSHNHISSLTAKVKYNTFPPSNGNHYFMPAVWGFYTSPVAPVQAVHNQEHGGIVLWWGDKVPASTIDQLQAFYNSSPNAMLGTPIAGLGDKIAITAWPSPPAGLGAGAVAICPGFDEKAFKTFRDAYRGKGRERFPVDQLVPGS